MPEFTIQYHGPYVCDAKHHESGETLRIVTARDEQPYDHPSPSDLLAAALGSCMVQTLAIAARVKFDLELRDITVRITSDFDEKTHLYRRIDLTFDIPQDVPEDLRPRLERSAGRCPVHKSLHPDIEISATYNWGA
ncbi:MAG: OsmC family protein [Phycisphaeraceae bacterium]